MVGRAGVRIAVADVDDLDRDGFIRREPSAGDEHERAGWIVRQIGGDGLRKGGGWRKQSAKNKEQSDEVADDVRRP